MRDGRQFRSRGPQGRCAVRGKRRNSKKKRVYWIFATPSSVFLSDCQSRRVRIADLRGKSRCPPRFAGSFLTECGQKRGVVRRTFFRNAEKKSVFPAMAEISCRKEIRLLAEKRPKSANKREVLFRKIFWLMPTERIGCQRSLPNPCFLSVNMRVFFLFAFRDYW